MPEFNVYSGAKAAVRTLTEVLDVEFALHNIRVSDILPAGVDTQLLKSQPKQSKLVSSMGAPDTPEAIAELAWQAVHGNRLHWFPPGHRLALYDKIFRLFPDRMRDRLVRAMKA